MRKDIFFSIDSNNIVIQCAYYDGGNIYCNLVLLSGSELSKCSDAISGCVYINESVRTITSSITQTYKDTSAQKAYISMLNNNYSVVIEKVKSIINN